MLVEEAVKFCSSLPFGQCRPSRTTKVCSRKIGPSWPQMPDSYTPEPKGYPDWATAERLYDEANSVVERNPNGDGPHKVLDDFNEWFCRIARLVSRRTRQAGREGISTSHPIVRDWLDDVAFGFDTLTPPGFYARAHHPFPLGSKATGNLARWRALRRNTIRAPLVPYLLYVRLLDVLRSVDRHGSLSLHPFVHLLTALLDVGEKLM